MVAAPKITHETSNPWTRQGRQRNGTGEQDDRRLPPPTVQSGHMVRLIDTVAAVHMRSNATASKLIQSRGTLRPGCDKGAEA